MSASGPEAREEPRDVPARTLGDVLYAAASGAPASEADWLRLVRRAAEGDSAALRALYERTHRPVFTLLVRLTSSREIAEQLTLAVYRDLPHQAKRYRAEKSTVVSWIMGRARSTAIARLRRDQRKNRRERSSSRSAITIDMPDYRNLLELRDQARRLREALTCLDEEEREAIEIVYFGALKCEEAAARLNCSFSKFKARLSRGMDRLEQALLPTHEQTRICRNDRGRTHAYALDAVPRRGLAKVRAHLSGCLRCRRKAEALKAVVDLFVAWPTDLLRPSASLRARLDAHGSRKTDRRPSRAGARGTAPDWTAVTQDISCQLLSADHERGLMSMLVRLAPGGEYPAHVHASTEELYLLDGQLWIDNCKVYPGGYNRAEAGTRDQRVWSQTGCMCVLVTSTRDVLI